MKLILPKGVSVRVKQLSHINNFFAKKTKKKQSNLKQIQVT